MGSPAIGILRSRHRSHRRPLQPKNTPSEPHRSSGGVKRGQSPRTIQSSPEDAIGGKENRPQELSAGIDPADTSLGKELVAVRRRRERIRSERERTEKLLIERSRMLDTAMRKAEDRWEAQLKMEAELRQVIRLRELGPSPSVFPSLRSLRHRALEARTGDVTPQVMSRVRDDGESPGSDYLEVKKSSGEEHSPSIDS